MVIPKKIYFFLGSGLSQAFALLTSFYILKFATAEKYGAFSYFISVGSIIGSVATLKFEQSIVISADLNESNAKFNLTLQTGLILTGIILLSFSFFYRQYDTVDYLLLFILANSVIVNAVIQQSLLFLEKHVFNGLLSLTSAFLNFVLILFLIHNENGLETSYVLAYGLTSVVFIFFIWKNAYRIRFLNYGRYAKLFMENLSYPRYVFPGAIFSILLTYGHPILIKYLYSEKNLGLFSISLRILLLPSILVGSVVAALFRAKLSKLFLGDGKSKIYSETVKMLSYLALGALVVFPIIVLLTFNLGLFFKLDAWQGLGKVSLYLCLFAASQFFFLPLSNILLVCDKHKALFRINIVQFAITLLVYFIAFYYKIEFEHFLLLLSVSLALFSIIACFYFVSVAKKLND